MLFFVPLVALVASQNESIVELESPLISVRLMRSADKTGLVEMLSFTSASASYLRSSSSSHALFGNTAFNLFIKPSYFASAAPL